MNASYRTNTPMSRPAATSLMQQPQMMFLMGLVGVTLLAGCVALIVLSIKLGSGNNATQVARAEAPSPEPVKRTVITQTPQSAPKPTATVVKPATTIPKPAVAPPPTPTGDNPWQMGSPNVLGAPVSGHTAVVVDGVEQSAPFLRAVLDAVAAGLGHAQYDTTASVFYIHNNEIKSFPGSPAAVGPATAEALRGFQQSIAPAGTRGFWNGFDAGVSSDAQSMIIITGRKSWDSSISLLSQKLAAEGAPAVTFIHIDADVTSLRDALLGASGGYRSVPLDQLNAWQSAQ